MGVQFSILLMSEDLDCVERLLIEECEAEIWEAPYGSDTLKKAGLSLPLSEMGKTALGRYISPAKLPLKAAISRLSANKTYVDIDRSNLIELWRPYIESCDIRPGRLFYQKRFIEQSHWVEKELPFSKWAERLFRTLKKELHPIELNRNKYFCGESALARLRSGTLRVIN
jgi:hypothetical protein